MLSDKKYQRGDPLYIVDSNFPFRCYEVSYIGKLDSLNTSCIVEHKTEGIFNIPINYMFETLELALQQRCKLLELEVMRQSHTYAKKESIDDIVIAIQKTNKRIDALFTFLYEIPFIKFFLKDYENN